MPREKQILLMRFGHSRNRLYAGRAKALAQAAPDRTLGQARRYHATDGPWILITAARPANSARSEMESDAGPQPKNGTVVEQFICQISENLKAAKSRAGIVEDSSSPLGSGVMTARREMARSWSQLHCTQKGSLTLSRFEAKWLAVNPQMVHLDRPPTLGQNDRTLRPARGITESWP